MVVSVGHDGGGMVSKLIGQDEAKSEMLNSVRFQDGQEQ